MARTAWPTTLSCSRTGYVRLVVLVGLVVELLRDRRRAPRLRVEIMRLLAALVDEVLGEIEIFLLAGDAGELDQRQLDLLVAAIARASARRAGPNTVAMWSA